MERLFCITLTVLAIVGPGPCHAVDRVEILLDNSGAMWEPYNGGMPRLAAVRAAITDFIIAARADGWDAEIGLRTFGGRSELAEGSNCGDSDIVLPGGPVDPSRWISALDGLDPRGNRGMVHAIERAAEDLGEVDRDRRIVVMTSGADQCHQDLAGLLAELAEGERPIQVRFVGLGIGEMLANILAASAPTRNPMEPMRLRESLRWAILPAGAPAARLRWLEVRLTLDGESITDSAAHLVASMTAEEHVAAIEDGKARVRLTPGRFQAAIEIPEFDTIGLIGVDHVGATDELVAALLGEPPVTLEIVPEKPVAGSEVHIQYWGAPPGRNWVAVAAPGPPAGSYVVRSQAPGAAGSVILRLPESPHEIDVRFTREAGSGIHQLMGQTEIVTSRRTISLEAPERVENRTPLTVRWEGVPQPGDHIAIAPAGAASSVFSSCIVAGRRNSGILTAPIAAGENEIRYITRTGRVLARSDLEVFEILATLDAPDEVASGEEFDVSWTGPDAPQDHLSVAAVGDGDDRYRSFAPTASGNPARLIAPRTSGNYELRYVRSADGEVLARESFSVVSIPITLEVPPEVEAGTRFQVEWNGTAGDGDFIAVAPARSGRKRLLDWAYTSLGSPVTLAAPFETGTYVVRYVSGTTGKIITRRTLEVR